MAGFSGGKRLLNKILSKNSKIDSQMYTGLYVKYPLFVSDFQELGFSLYISDTSPYIKSHESSSSPSRDVPCDKTKGQT